MHDVSFEFTCAVGMRSNNFSVNVLKFIGYLQPLFDIFVSFCSSADSFS